jgi:hypothetical protein
MFEGRLGAVDEWLVREGRLKLLTSPADVVPVRRDRAGGQPVRRDPVELLRLAVPGA